MIGGMVPIKALYERRLSRSGLAGGKEVTDSSERVGKKRPGGMVPSS